jgi:hypothetical protein
MRWRQGAWAQRGLVSAWKGEVVLPGVPESQCVYRTKPRNNKNSALGPIMSPSFLNAVSRE